MKKGNANYKTKKFAARALAVIMHVTCIVMPVLGNTESKNGLEVTLETDKETYSLG